MSDSVVGGIPESVGGAAQRVAGGIQHTADNVQHAACQAQGGICIPSLDSRRDATNNRAAPRMLFGPQNSPNIG